MRQRDVPGTISGRGHSLALKAGGSEGGVGSSRLGTSHRIVHMPASVLSKDTWEGGEDTGHAGLEHTGNG